MKPGIKLMADYDCWPLWHQGGDEVGNIDPASLGLSNALLSGLDQWACTYDAHLNRDDPAASSWTAEEKKTFESDGKRFAGKLASEIGDRFLVYYSSRGISMEVRAKNAG